VRKVTLGSKVRLERNVRLAVEPNWSKKLDSEHVRLGRNIRLRIKVGLGIILLSERGHST
jgi:hypothetical protein